MAGHDNSWKKIYNRRIRRTTILDDVDDRPSRYKRLNCPWNISDFPCVCTWDNFWIEIKSQGQCYCCKYDELNKENCKKCFDRWYKRK